MYWVRLLGVVLCPIFLIYFGTLGIYTHMRSLSGLGVTWDKRVLVILSLVGATTIVITAYFGLVLEVRSRMNQGAGGKS